MVCPTGIKRQKGETFNCIATLAQGDMYPFRVTQKDARGNVHYEQAAAGATKGTTKRPSLQAVVRPAPPAARAPETPP